MIALHVFSLNVKAQNPIQNLQGRFGRLGSGSKTSDSIHHRNKFEDSITISFHYLDSSRSYKLDTSILDFTTRFLIPASNIYLGNVGNASKSILFSPNLSPGWDPGFHAFDIYKFKMDQVRFFNTTRPYSELNYVLGTRAEQIIEVLHTQNVKPYWNISLRYRLINSPGFFKNLKTNHNNYLFTSWYQSKRKRYNNYFVILANNLQSGESGGILSDKNYLSDPVYKDRFNIPTQIGGDPAFGTNFFSTTITTGNKYKEFTFLMRQQYDLGRKDSLVTDSTVIPLFYPRLRFEHTFTYSSYSYAFQDYSNTSIDGTVYIPDTNYYKNNYGYTLVSDSVYFHDSWKELLNDFSIYQFPDAKNLQQFIRIGAAVQNLTGEFLSGKKAFYNVYGHAEYRNKTKNKKWDLEANGKLYFTGMNAGDYQAYGSLQRYTGNKFGYLQLGAENINRTPSFNFNNLSSFYFFDPAASFKKENGSHLFASIFQPAINLKLTGNYYLLTNYTYITEYYKLQQQSSLFNVLQISLEKTLKLAKHWYWHADVYFQQAVGNAPVNLPLVFTRNRIAFEGNFGLKNLNLTFGTEIRYHTPYNADGYSPVIGQFYKQDSLRNSEQLPDISLFLHLRIRTFKAFIQAENLNTAQLQGGFGFINNNLAAPGYPYPGFQLRIGIYWSFIN